MDRKPGESWLAASLHIPSCHTAQGTILPPPVSLGTLPLPPSKSVRDLHLWPRTAAVAFRTGELFFYGWSGFKTFITLPPCTAAAFLRCDFLFPCLPPEVTLPCFAISCQARHLTPKENVFTLPLNRSAAPVGCACPVVFVRFIVRAVVI